MPRYPLSLRTACLPVSRWVAVWRATMTSLRLPGQQCPTAMTRRLWALMMIWVLTLRRYFLLMAVIDWSCAGMRVPSMPHGWVLSSGVDYRELASAGTR